MVLQKLIVQLIQLINSEIQVMNAVMICAFEVKLFSFIYEGAGEGW